MKDLAHRLRVLVVDDHDIVHLGVKHLFGERAEVLDANTLLQARAQLTSRPCDLMLLDLGLGEGFSLGALPRLREDFPQLKIIVLTSMAEELYAERALRAGADGYVMKSALGQTLLEASDRVLSGQIYASTGVSNSLMRRAAGRDVTAGRPTLSARETEVLRLMASGQSTREIAETLNRSIKTIESHKQSLKAKLGADSPARLMRMAVTWFADAP
ncbi:MAG: response regulator transcription factor [Burkholderiaceae bacterium]